MCGICGEINFNGNIKIENIRKMCGVLSHRGPDDEGMVFFRDGKSFEINGNSSFPPYGVQFEVGLGHRRLSIIDLSEAAHQPMCNEDKTVWIVFNGEIYNFRELRIILEKKGHIFKSKSDTEVIIHGYEEWGIDCLHKLRGMFVFAIWESKKKRLFLARDRLGEKPLVYYFKNGLFIFASEIKAILNDQRVERKVNNTAIHYYLTYQYIPSPETIFNDIKKLPPAHYLLYDCDGNMKIKPYWRLKFNSNQQNYNDLQELKDQIRKKLEESVKLRMISDVPLGAFLSGGVDSSIVVGLMARLSGKPIKTFSIGFEEEDFDELYYARIVSNHFKTEHHEFIVKPNAIEILPKLVWHYNEPFGDSSAIPTYYVSKMTKDHVKVVLTGDGGDENFAGYSRYLRSKYVFWFTKLPEAMRGNILSKLLRILSFLPWKRKTLNRLADFIEMLSSHQGINYAEQIKIFNNKEKVNLYSDDFARQIEGKNPLDYLTMKYEEAIEGNFLEHLLYLDMMTYLPEDLLVKVDIATMANSLEARVPFLDHKLIEFVTTIPSRFKLRGRKTKFILKEVFKDFLPDPILKRKKMGFGVPVSKWFRNELKNYSKEILLDQRTLKRGYFKREGIEHLFNEHLALRYDHSAKIWALLFFEIWFRVFIDKEGDFIF